jgi:hypothetical protein
VKGAAGAVGVAGLAGGGLALAGRAADDGAGAAPDSGDGPMLVHIADPAAGTVEVLWGEHEIQLTDRALVARVLRATR